MLCLDGLTVCILVEGDLLRPVLILNEVPVLICLNREGYGASFFRDGEECVRHLDVVETFIHLALILTSGKHECGCNQG